MNVKLFSLFTILLLVQSCRLKQNPLQPYGGRFEVKEETINRTPNLHPDYSADKPDTNVHVQSEVSDSRIQNRHAAIVDRLKARAFSSVKNKAAGIVSSKWFQKHKPASGGAGSILLWFIVFLLCLVGFTLLFSSVSKPELLTAAMWVLGVMFVFLILAASSSAHH